MSGACRPRCRLPRSVLACASTHAQHRREGRGTALGCGEGGHAAAVEMTQDARCLRADEDQERLVALAQRLGHRACHEIRLAQARGADDDGDGIIGRALEERADGAAEEIGLQAGQGDVDRVAVEHGVADVEGAQALRRRLVRWRRLEAGKPGAVGDQGRGPAGRGQDGDPPAAQPSAGVPGPPGCRAGRRRWWHGSRRSAGRGRRRPGRHRRAHRYGMRPSGCRPPSGRP